MIAINQFLVHKVLPLKSRADFISQLSAIVAWVFLAVALASTSHAAEVTLEWDDWDNNPEEVGVYTVYIWQEDWDFPESHIVGLDNMYTLSNLDAGEVYDFAVTVADTDGERESQYSNIVSASLPASDFNVSGTNGYAPLPVSFTDLSTGNITSWFWDFGDGSVSTDQDPTHTYRMPGVYTVSLKVDGPEGSDTLMATDLVRVQQDSSSTTMHVDDLDGSSVNNGRTWTAVVSIMIGDANHRGVAGGRVSGTWQGSYTGAGVCTTDQNGTCSITSGDIRKNNSQVTFTVNNVTHNILSYQPADNHDNDGDSDGVHLTVMKP